jgi:hypothetical protein
MPKRKYDDYDDDTKSVEHTSEEATVSPKKSKHGDDDTKSVENTSEEATVIPNKSKHGDDDTKCQCPFCRINWFQPDTGLVMEHFDLFEHRYHLRYFERCADMKNVEVCQTGSYGSIKRTVMSCHMAFKMCQTYPSQCRFWIARRTNSVKDMMETLRPVFASNPHLNPHQSSTTHFHWMPDASQGERKRLMAAPIVLDRMGFAQTTGGIWAEVQPIFTKDEVFGVCVACNEE